MEISGIFEGKTVTIFETLVASLQADYQQSTGRELTISEIKPGLTYKKRFGKQNENEILVSVRGFESPNFYEVAISSNRGLQLLSYHIEEVTEKQVRLVYSEDYLPETYWQNLNYKILLPLMKKGLQKRMFGHLEQLVNVTNNKEVQ